MKTFYRPEMNVSSNSSYSPSAGKPKAFIEHLLNKGFDINLVDDFVSVSIPDLALAHDINMVEGILNLQMSNGF